MEDIDVIEDPTYPTVGRLQVTHIVDPITFWIIIKDDDAFIEIEALLTNHINGHQSQGESSPFIDLAVPGRLVAVQHSGTKIWQRAQVQRKAGDYNCQVFLLDHGIAIVVPNSILRPLPDLQGIQTNFYSSCLHLKGLLPSKFEVNLSNGRNEQVSGIPNEWDPASFTFVADKLRQAEYCYILEKGHWDLYGDVIVGELFIVIDGCSINLSKELIKYGYVISSPGAEMKFVNYLLGSDSLRLGPNVNDHLQVSNPMGTTLCAPNYNVESHDDSLGIAILPKKRDHLVPENSAGGVDEEIIFYPAGMPVKSISYSKNIPAGNINKFVSNNVTNPPQEPNTSLVGDSDQKSNRTESPSLKVTPPNKSRPTRAQLLEDMKRRRSLLNQSVEQVTESPTASTPPSQHKSSPKALYFQEKLREYNESKTAKTAEEGRNGVATPSKSSPSSRVPDCTSPSNAKSDSPATPNNDFKFKARNSKCRQPQRLSLGNVQEMKSINLVLAHGKNVDQILEVADAPFPQAVHTVLQEMQFQVLTNIQKYSWPAVLRGDNVVMVSSARGGKTNGFLIPLISLLLNPKSYSTMPRGNGPLALILCPTSRCCEDVADICSRFLMNFHIRVRFIITHGGGAELEKKKALMQGCEILISTPRCLVRLIGYSSTLVDMSRLCHVVLEDAHDLMDKFGSEVRRIVSDCQYFVLKRISKGIVKPFQMITCSERWCMDLFALVHSVTPNPLLLIGNYLEAAIYAHVKPHLLIVDTETKKKKISEILERKVGVDNMKTVIICREVSSVFEIVKFLGDRHHLLVAHENLERCQMDDVLQAWKAPVFKTAEGYTILICTDAILPDLMTTNATCIIHYNLPGSKTSFGLRFSCLMDNYPNIHIKSDELKPECQVHIFVDEENQQQLHGVVQFMKRLGANIHDMLKDASDELSNSKERMKTTQPICYSLKAFGECLLAKNQACNLRHIFCNSDQPVGIPSSGRVKLKIVTVLDTSWLSARLIEITSLSGLTEAAEDDFTMIAMELAMYYGIKKNRILHGNPKLGDICAVEYKIDFFQRAQVVQILTFDKFNQPLSVKVRLMDNGRTITNHVMTLMLLPEHLMKYRPQVVDVFLCRLMPIDLDTTWSRASYHKVENWLECADAGEKFGKFIIGDIKLSLANTLWLDPVHIRHSLETIEVEVVEIALRRQLLKECVAVENPDHLKKLYALCEDTDIPLPIYVLPKSDLKPPGKETVAVKPLPAPRWAYLPDSDNSKVIFLSAEHPGKLFVRQLEFESILTQLTNMIQDHALEQQKINPGGSAMVIKAGLHCLGKFEGEWGRAVVLTVSAGEDVTKVELFFVDHGDVAIVDAATDIMPIYEIFITGFPFQAIECSLAGLEDTDSQSKARATDLLYDITVDEEGRAKVLNYVIDSKLLVASTGGCKYSIILLDPAATDDSVINRVILNSGFMKAKADETDLFNSLSKIMALATSEEEDLNKEMEEIVRSPEECKAQDVVRLTDLEGISVSSCNQTEELLLNKDESCFDFEIDDVAEFLFYFMHGKNKDADMKYVALKSLPKQPQICAPIVNASEPEPEKEKNSGTNACSDVPYWNMRPSASNGTAPNVVWYQDMEFVHLSIEIVDVKEYFLTKNVENPMFIKFETTVGGKDYRLDLDLFGGIIPGTVEDFKTGRRVVVKLQKIVKGNWLHLLEKPDKFYFWLKYDLSQVHEIEGYSLMDEDKEMEMKNLNSNLVCPLVNNEEKLLTDLQYYDSDSDDSVNEDFVGDDLPIYVHDNYES